MNYSPPLVTKCMLTNGWALVIESNLEKFERIAQETRERIQERIRHNGCPD
jgi:hypothetical protein